MDKASITDILARTPPPPPEAKCVDLWETPQPTKFSPGGRPLKMLQSGGGKRCTKEQSAPGGTAARTSCIASASAGLRRAGGASERGMGRVALRLRAGKRRGAAERQGEKAETAWKRARESRMRRGRTASGVGDVVMILHSGADEDQHVSDTRLALNERNSLCQCLSHDRSGCYI